MMHMIRTQIQLTEEQARHLRRIAAERGISVAALIREAVERMVAVDPGPARLERALSAIGRFASNRRDISTEHDRYLADDFAS